MKIISLFLLTALCLATPPAPRNDQWTVIGPGGGGAQFIPTVSPHDPKRVLVACDMTGAYVSNDGGASWRMFNLRAPVSFFVFDPLDPDVIYAEAASLFRSTDGARTWKLVYPAPNTVAGLSMADDHAEVELQSTGDPSGTISALAVDPANSKALFATIREGAAESLYVSSNWGATWNRSVAVPTGTRKIYVDPKSPRENRTLYILGPSSVTVRLKGEWKQQPNPSPGSSWTDASAGFAADGRLVVYATMRDSVFVSDDGGANWRQSVLPGKGAHPRAAGTSRQHPDTAYVSYSRLQLDGGAWFGVAHTTDRGRTWRLVWKEADRSPAANVHDAWITARFGPSWGENPLSLGVSATDPNLCYATDLGRTLRTTDGGKTWEAVYSTRRPDAGFETTGLDVTTSYGVFFDPFDVKRMFIAYTDIGLFRSEDAGRSWASATIGVPRAWTNTTYWIMFDPSVRGRVWGVMSGTHDLPRPKIWRRTSPETYAGGVCISNDGGKTWRPSNRGMLPSAVTHILLDPDSPASARVLYATALGRGVYKSTDGGVSWQLKNNGLPESQPFAWRLARDSEGALYLVIARRSEDGTFGNDGDGALYCSTDGAGHWTRVDLPPGVNGPNGLAIDPRNPKRLYLAAWRRKGPEPAAGGGIYLSTDAGIHWSNVLSKDQHVYDITIDPRDPDHLYACGFESSAWRSADRGVTWTRIKGYNFKWGHRVILDPNDANKIYITTFGGSVWHGPAAGDPGALEDIVTPQIAYGRFYQ